MTDTLSPPPPDLAEVAAPARSVATAPCCGNCSAWRVSAKMPDRGLCMAKPPTGAITKWRIVTAPVTGITVMEPLSDGAIFPTMLASGWCRDGWQPAGKPEGETSH